MSKLEIELEKELEIEGLTANFNKNSVKDILWQALIKARIELDEIENLIGKSSSAIFDEYRAMKKELEELKSEKGVKS